ncbi:hypothetical protein [Dictyobacter arantiisoli]|uniref:hypothetical protein n=1 Tax=Dictyobacter arantiisoli TaxID=2014874 RepID=UPI00155ABDC5|nr:hypothetical protein [Dictyobacter arantiisoli]
MSLRVRTRTWARSAPGGLCYDLQRQNPIRIVASGLLISGASVASNSTYEGQYRYD